MRYRQTFNPASASARTNSGLSSQMKCRITIQAPSDVPDGSGGVQRDWQDICSVWAAFSPLSGKESLWMGQLQSARVHRITIRYRDDIDTSMRILYRNREFQIRAMLCPDEARRVLELYVEER